MKFHRLITRMALPAALALSACVGSGGDHPINGGSAEPPVFLDCKAVSSKEIAFRFSKSVRVLSLTFDPAAAVESVGEGKTVAVALTAPLKAGVKMTADILVEDEQKNTLSVLVPFSARNDQVPGIVINELRADYSKPRSEFVEFRATSAGNIGALRLYISGKSGGKTGEAPGEPVYEFPPVEVTAGEYIVLHLRTLDTDEGAADETGDDLALSGGADARADARDFWISGSEKILHKTDAVYLLDQDGGVVDAVLMAEAVDAKAVTAAHFSAAAAFLAQAGAWLPAEGGAAADQVPGPGDAALTAGCSATKTLSRNEAAADTNRAGDWYVTAASGATPGAPNKPPAAPADPETPSPAVPVEPAPEPTPVDPETLTPPVNPDLGLPALLLTEMRTEYSKPKAEFVELRALSDGNLSGLRLFVSGNSLTEATYEFPPAAVREGEYIVLHLRVLDTDEGAADETGDDLALSGGADARVDARDFWIDGSEKRLRRTDAVYLLDHGSRVVDAALLNEDPEAKVKASLASAAAFLADQNAWIGDGILTQGVTATRTVCRNESAADTNRAADWYVAATSGATPGLSNKPNAARR